jgi:hypothetical protein
MTWSARYHRNEITAGTCRRRDDIPATSSFKNKATISYARNCPGLCRSAEWFMFSGVPVYGIKKKRRYRRAPQSDVHLDSGNSGPDGRSPDGVLSSGCNCPCVYSLCIVNGQLPKLLRQLFGFRQLKAVKMITNQLAIEWPRKFLYLQEATRRAFISVFGRQLRARQQATPEFRRKTSLFAPAFGAEFAATAKLAEKA